jgi:hypothetical protein
MASNRLRAATASDPHLIPPALAAWLSVFRCCFTAPVWNRVLVLVAGAVLAPGKRTVTQALRVMGLGEAPQARRYHEVLDQARSDACAVARQLLLYVLDRLLPNGPVVIGIDDTVERRGIYRDPVRSSKVHFVKTSGLRWLSLMVVVPISWSGPLGAAVPDRSRPIGAVERDPPQATQDADRLGTPGDPANQTLAACSL